MKNEIIILSNNIERTDSLLEFIKNLDSSFSVSKITNVDKAISRIGEKSPKIIFSDTSFGFDSALRLLNYSFENRLNTFNYFIHIVEDSDSNKISEIINFGFDDYMIGHQNQLIIQNRIRVGQRSLEFRSNLNDEKEKYKELALELSNNLEDLIKLSASFIEIRIPASKNMMRKIAELSEKTATKLGDISEEKVKNLIAASCFSQAGRLHLPDKFLNKPVMKDGRVSDDIMYQVPSINRAILSEFPRYKDVSEIVYHIWENFDGSGFPSKVKKWQIPIESRIIRVVLDYEELRFFRDYSRNKAIEEIKYRSNKLYDPRVVNSFITVISNMIGEEDSQTEFVLLPELKPGMVLMNDIHTSSGLKMLGVGTELNEKSIDYLIKYSVNDPIIGSIQIDKAFFQS